MGCPLCDYKESRSSWFGSTYYDEKEFEYLECTSCNSLYCSLMPDAMTLSKMYGPDYFGSEADHESAQEPDVKFQQALAFLERIEKGKLLDYGCGAGEFLERLSKLGWQIAGVELDSVVAQEVSERLSAKVVIDPNELGHGYEADVLHLGDVIEHLTDLNRQMPDILKLLKKGGYLIADGPLEAHPNLFTLILKLYRQIGKRRSANMPPFHVLLATAKGQKYLFERFGLEEVCFEVSEVSHPAPPRIAFIDVWHPQKIGMYSIRKLSQLISRVSNKKLGNRYFYVGKKL